MYMHMVYMCLCIYGVCACIWYVCMYIERVCTCIWYVCVWYVHAYGVYMYDECTCMMCRYMVAACAVGAHICGCMCIYVFPRGKVFLVP